MSNVFLISDTHFNHTNITSWISELNGKPVRPWDSVEEMDEAMVDNWNNMVKVEDKVYHLGDVSMNRNGIKIMDRLNGTKVLIKGNHDIHPLKCYLPYFKDIRGSHKLDKLILTHFPLHRYGSERFLGNVHGHLHEWSILDSYGDDDPWYFSVCVEHINFTPIAFDDILKHFRV
ncbi:hypothetical protein M0R04_04315 [Candidatus Dojkabacteria bacterium]|jgi:calcineurin-like phosphoesterase family protein|nr:hypothetical protein [Candidatus Dojkabacteria bacterium]